MQYSYKALVRRLTVAGAIGRGLAISMRDTDTTSKNAWQLRRAWPRWPQRRYPYNFMGELDMARSNSKVQEWKSLAGDFEDMTICKDFINDVKESERSEF